MTKPVVIEVANATAAECVAAAVAPFGGELAEADGGWFVSVDLPRPRELNSALHALHDCLNAHAIPSVVVTIDDAPHVLRAIG